MEATWQKRSWERQQARRCVRSHRTRSPPHFWCFPFSSFIVAPSETLVLTVMKADTLSPHSPGSFVSSEQKLGYCHPASHNYFNKHRNYLANTFLDHKMPNKGFGILGFYWSVFPLIKWAKPSQLWGEERGWWGDEARGWGCSCEAEMWYGACVALALTGRVADALAPQSREDEWRRRRKMREANRPTDALMREEIGEFRLSTPVEVFLALHPTKEDNKEGKQCLSLHPSHLCTQHTHHTSCVSLSSNRVAVMLALLLTPCHVVSILLCNFLFPPPPPPLSRKECLSPWTTSQCQWVKTVHSTVWVGYSVSTRCLKDSTNSCFCSLNCDATWGNAIEIIPDTSCTQTGFIFLLVHAQVEMFIPQRVKNVTMHVKLSRALFKTFLLCMAVNGKGSDDIGIEAERARAEKKSKSKNGGGVMTRSAQDRRGDRGGSVSDRLLVAPLWRLWSSDPSRNLSYYKASPLHTGTTTKWSNYI